jgi:hypothetical protein
MSKSNSRVFDYRALRLLVGIIAFSLPFVVTVIANSELGSISGSYYTNARDVFVGMLFIVGAFLWAYNGHKTQHKISQKTLSKIAAVAAIGVAVFPTSQGDASGTWISGLHYASAAVLFLILTRFCFVFFRVDIKGKGGKKGLRSKVYFVCGWIMILCMLAIALKQVPMVNSLTAGFALVFWAEAIALCAFGAAWIVAGKYLSLFTEPEEMLALLEPKNEDT